MLEEIPVIMQVFKGVGVMSWAVVFSHGLHDYSFFITLLLDFNLSILH
jgi:hypothetical protein